MKKNPGKPRLPWVTKDGYLDLAKLPIDSILKQGLSLDISQFRSACRLLATMEAHGRKEAGVYLVGLFYRFRDDLERLITVVEQLLKRIQSEAYRKAQEVKGKADAEATRIYAQAYSVDADFYQFLKTLETYRSSLDSETWLLLSMDSEFLKFLKGSQK